MKKSLIYFLTAAAVAAGSGCKENLPPATTEKSAVLEIELKCRKCYKVSKLKECKRINQVLFNCPHCQQVINAEKSRVKK